MGWPKGKKRPEVKQWLASRKGVPNKITRDIREAYKNLVEMNLDNMTFWLEQIAEKDPQRAFEMIINLSEYVVPKLARTELGGANGQPIEVNVVNFLPNANYNSPQVSTTSIRTADFAVLR